MRFRKKNSRFESGEPEIDGSAADGDDISQKADDSQATKSGKRRTGWARIAVFAVLPALLLAVTLGAAYLKWEHAAARDADLASSEALQAAKDAAVALLSYRPDTAQEELDAASERLTGSFKNQYRDLITNVVIPGAREKHISAAANVSTAATVSATSERAVVLLFVDQTTTVGSTPPTDLQSSVRVTMDKVGDRWLLSGFEPI